MLVRYYSEIIIISLLALLFVLSPNKARAQTPPILCATVMPECEDGIPVGDFKIGPCAPNYYEACALQNQQVLNAEIESCELGVEYTSNELLIAQQHGFEQEKLIQRLRRKLRKAQRNQ